MSPKKMWTDNDGAMQKMCSLRFIPVIGLGNALNMEELKLDHGFFRVKHAVSCCSNLFRGIIQHTVKTDPVPLIIVLYPLTNFSY